jgi:hypothetical protein
MTQILTGVVIEQVRFPTGTIIFIACTLLHRFADAEGSPKLQIHLISIHFFLNLT